MWGHLPNIKNLSFYIFLPSSTEFHSDFQSYSIERQVTYKK